MLNRFIERLAERGEASAFLGNGWQVSYRKLYQAIVDWKGIIDESDIQAGDVVAVCGEHSWNSIALILGLCAKGVIVVPLTTESDEKEKSFLRIAAVNLFFKFCNGSDYCLERVNEHCPRPDLYSEIPSDDAGLILFSSGTTGVPKAVLHKISKFMAKYDGVSGRPYRIMAFLKLDHIGGMNTVFHTLVLGGGLVLCDSRDPVSVCELIDACEVEVFPTTPTFLNMMLISDCHRGFNLSSLKIITYGTEPMPEQTLAMLNNLFPNVKLKQTYGLTELGILSTKSEQSKSLKMKLGGRSFETKIVDGVLWIRSECSMLGYLNAESPFDEDGWYNTGDRVEVEGEYIRVLGRDSDLINVGGEKVYPAEIESCILQVKGVCSVIVKGVANPITGSSVVAQIMADRQAEQKELRRAINKHCKDNLLPYKRPVYLEFMEEPLHNERFKLNRTSSVAFS